MRIRAFLMRLIALPGWGHCRRCGRPWRFVQYHTTNFWRSPEGRSGRGCFALCEQCWESLSPTKRLPYYDQVIDGWIKIASSDEERANHEADRLLIHQAVLEGK